MKKQVLFLGLCLLSAGFLWSFDYGLVVENEVQGSQEGLYYDGFLIPWFSVYLNDKADLYLSGTMQFEYNYDEWNFIPDLGRFELTYRFTPAAALEVGRIPHMDITAGLVNAGLYDGALGTFSPGNNTFRAGAFYTGLQAKENAEIVLSLADALDYLDSDVYFAPRRMLVTADFTMPGILGMRKTLAFGALGQFDLRSDVEERVNSQYVSARYSFYTVPGLGVDLSGIASFTETEAEDFSAAMAASLDILWNIPNLPNHRLFGGARYASGDSGPFIPYLPINNLSQGDVFSPDFSGITRFQLGYGVRFIESLYGELKASYYLRNDMNTILDPDIDPDSDSYSLGGEFYATAVWVPVSDISVILGGGTFIPQMGKAFESDAEIQWLVSFALVLSF